MFQNRPGIRVLALAVAVAQAVSAQAADHGLEKGQPLSQALQVLSKRYGLATVYSSSLITNELRVKQVPTDVDPVMVRAELLAQHGLRCASVRARCVVERVAKKRSIPPSAGGEKKLSPATLLKEVAVSPGHYSLMAEGANFMSADEIAATPHLADDVFRLARSLPGITGGDYSAPFHVRGGQTDEVALRLDGLELYKPFHLHNLNNALGIVDSNLIGGIDVYTGAWPGRFGGRMSAVMDIRSREVDGDMERRLGVSAINAFATHAQSSADGDRSFIGSARTGYLDFVLNFVDPGGEIDPRYHDLFLRYRHRLNETHEFSMHLLSAGDDVLFETDDRNERSDGQSDSNHLWLRWQSDWSENWQSESVLAYTSMDQSRIGFAFDRFETSATVRDLRDLQGIRLDHRINGTLSERARVEFGAEWRDESTEYDYRSRADVYPLFANTPVCRERQFVGELESVQAAAWMDTELLLSPQWQLRAGLRYSYYAPEERSDGSIDPHIALAWQSSSLGTFRAAIARVSQSQRSDELAVEDGESLFFEPERATQVAISWEHQLTPRVQVRAELFQKQWDELRPRFQNLFEPIELFPEVESDRILVAADEASSQGLELGFSGEHEHGRWWSRYVYSRSRERVHGEWFTRSWDQPHAIHLGWDRRMGAHWRLTTQLDAHSGWPTTPVIVTSDQSGFLQARFGKRNSDRFDPYINLSARLSHEKQYADSSLTWYVEAFNLLDRENANQVEQFRAVRDANGDVKLDRVFGGGLPILPSFGIVWKF